MLKNYFLTIWRNMWRHKVYSTINVLGLSLGICASLVLYLIISFELSFDTFHKDKERIYRVIGDVTESTGDKLHFTRIPLPLSQIARAELSDIEVVTGLIPLNAKVQVMDGNNQIKEFESKLSGTNYITIALTEPQYFDIFKYQWLAGNAATALQAPLRVVLTENKARQYFGSTPLDKIIGKHIIYQDSLLVSVSGIIKDWDKKSDISFTDFISFATLKNSFLKNNISTDSWKQGDMNTWTFVKLSEGKTPQKINAQMAKIVKSHADSQIKLSTWLEPITNVHFNADIIENPIRTAHMPTLYGLMGIAVFILILAIINFVNLSTAQAIQRTKEISVRKILGSNRTSLIFQFLTETFLYTLLSLLLAIFFINPVINEFHSFIPKDVAFDFLQPSTLTFLGLLISIIPVLAGLYPAIELSSNKPALSLKGTGTERGSKKWLLKKGLIVFQFTVSIVFIIGSIVVSNQLQYTREKDLGFSSDAIITIETPRGENASKMNVLINKIKQIPKVYKVAKQWQTPMHDNPRGMKLKFKSTDERDTWVTQIAGDEDFISLYEIRLLAGRNLVKTDTVNELIINENLSKFIGDKSPEQSIGKVLYWNDKPYPIVGVVADFHSKSFHNPIEPLCIINRPEREGSLAIKLSSKGKQVGAITSSLSQIEKIWKEVYPDKTFNFQFFDESLAMLYEKDQKTSKLMNTAMLITIFISGIGLFGLGMFTTEKRTKEIGIRKVLGASITNIVTMLTKDFLGLVIIALLIASPIGWYFMSLWLQDFAYRTEISWWVFALAGIGALIITLLTVSYQAIKAALMNPVISLKAE